MTNFGDLVVQERDSVALQSFWHVINGIYIWEYVTTLNFELDIIRKRRPYRWTIWIYSLARAALLIAIIINFVVFDAKTPMDCKVLITLQIVIAYVSQLSASLLVIVRIIAIWNKNKFVVAFAAITWVTNVSVVIEGVVRLQSTWSPLLQVCVMLDIEKIKPTFVVTVINDSILLVTMLVGLFRWYSFGLGRLLWKQGIIWLLIATIAGVPPMVFIFLNLNVPFNAMFLFPSVITNTIAATRIHRSLIDYTFGSSNIHLDGFSKGDSKVSKMKWNSPAPISLDRIEVAVETAYDQYSASRTTLSVGAQQGDKPHELSVGSDLECAIETSKADLQIPAVAATVQRDRA